MSEKNRARVIKKLGRSHVVWFPESNRWIEFKEPAWFIYRMHENGEDEDKISDQLSKRYSLPQIEARRFLREIIGGIRQFAGTSLPGTGSTKETGVVPEFNYTDMPLSGEGKTRHYLVNNREISITYGSPVLEYYIHRPLAHLEAGAGSAEPVLYELYEHPDEPEENNKPRYLFRQRMPDWPRYRVYDDPGLLRHDLYREIASRIYDIPKEGWMSFIHASAVTNGSEAILLCSSSGSGKSTMAALLQSPSASPPAKPDSRFYFMSDDFVPVDAVSKKAHVFPAALALKEGSFPLISRLYDPARDADSGYRGLTNRNIRYLRPSFPERDQYKPREVKSIVFIRYDPAIKFKMKKIPAAMALTMFHQEAWVSHNPEHARKFIDWFVTISFYKLDYSDNQKAIKAISGLFKIT
jgi:hypothetical protein